MSADAVPAPAAGDEAVPLPWRTRLAMLTRMLAVQGSWNYETMLGTGIGFSTEPALRALPGGRGGPAYRDAVARETRYFNAHPYLAAIAVGALARAEVDGRPPAQIERFRAALCGPLGSVGDRLVWAGWLPFSALLALLALGLGAGPLAVTVLFLVVYNAGHIALRAWGLQVGWSRGLRVASALGTPLLRQGPQWLARATLFLSGIALPLAGGRLLGVIGGGVPAPRHGLAALEPWGIVAYAGAAILGALLVRMHGRVEGWRVALAMLALVTLISIAR